MTNTDALSHLKGCVQYAKIAKLKYMTVSVDAIEVAIKHLKKQIPVKPKREDNDRTYCPICRNPDIRWIKDFPDSYCWRCGQRLDWGNEK